MGRLNTYFDREEFACKCKCGFDTVDYTLLKIVTDVREFFGRPVRVNSACRCEEHNKKIGGSPRSQHKLGKAADIVVDGVEPSEVARYLDNKYKDKHGVGDYASFTHVDSRDKKARWKG
jgi:uncharacterized protein YcbK (DUF882 family)